MPVTREDLKKDMSADHRAKLQAIFDNSIANDEWANKIFKKVGILIASYPGQRAYLKSCVESHAKLGYFICLTYDNYIDPKLNVIDHNSFMPDKEILDKVDLFMLPHHQTWGDVNYPYFWQLKWGASALQQFEYIYCINGDFIIEKPEGFEELLKIMEDGDFMSCGPDFDDEVSTGAFICRSKAFLQINQYMQDHFIPFDNYEKYIEMGGAEARMQAAIKHYGLKRVDTPKPNVWDCNYDPQGTWYDLVGLRHIHGELDYAFKKRLIPPHYEYIEEKYLLPIYNYKKVKEFWDAVDNMETPCLTCAEWILEDWWRK